MITGAILAGGFGTRLRPVLNDVPKVLAPVGGRPFLTYLLDQLSSAGILKVVLCTGYLADQIHTAIGSSYGQLQIVYSQEHQPVGTAGALALALPFLDSDPTLVMNGDSYCELDPTKFIQWHRQKRAVASLALVHSEDTSRFGRVTCDENGQIFRFGEKRSQGSGWINGGIYLLSQSFLGAIPQGNVSMEYDIFPRYVGKGLFGYPEGKQFIDIGTPTSYANSEAVMLGRRPKLQDESLSSAYSGELKFQRCVLLDRDGTINIERHYLSDPDQFELLPGVVEGLRQLQSAGFGLVIVSNQSGIGRGYLDQERLKAIHRRMKDLLRREGIYLHGIYVCPHLPEDHCDCRKPKAALGHRATEELGFDPKQSFVIGDKESDIMFGRNLGSKTILVLTGYGREVHKQGQHRADYIADGLSEAAAMIIHTLDEKVTSTVTMVHE